MDEEPEELPDPLAALDQLLRAVKDVATVVRGYHQALLEAGFAPAEALALTVSYQQTILTAGK